MAAWHRRTHAADMTVVDTLPVRCVLLFVHSRYEHCAIVPCAVVTEVLLDLNTTPGMRSKCGDMTRNTKHCTADGETRLICSKLLSCMRQSYTAVRLDALWRVSGGADVVNANSSSGRARARAATARRWFQQRTETHNITPPRTDRTLSV